ncbi:hypothetical protein IQ250_00370 [Pseudanabaenaceae cyanobacterium LEGE 13415]|nr:hypothetical protein [Pseudanabaenaceae cyanobacterium LEGE 13415]
MYQQKIVQFSALSVGCSLAIGTAIAMSQTLPAISQTAPATQANCIPLRVVDGNGSTTTRKSISSPGVLPGVNNNWNTDFAVPTGRRFTSYIATITPENAAEYDVTINLKYSNNTSTEVFDGDNLALGRFVPYQLKISTPPEVTRQPYQVNLNIRGTLGNTYQARVFACQAR